MHISFMCEGLIYLLSLKSFPTIAKISIFWLKEEMDLSELFECYTHFISTFSIRFWVSRESTNSMMSLVVIFY